MEKFVQNNPFAQPSGTSPYVGIATFAGYPFWDIQSRADAAILGVPYDEGCSNKPGTRFGPRSIRQASMLYAYEGVEERFYDADRRKWILRGKNIVDAGDVDIEPLCRERNFDAITGAVSAILNKGAVPAVLGGDHSITYPVVKAFSGRKIHYVHFDTHVDCDRIFKSEYTHGSPVARILEDGLAESITLLGIRGLANSGNDVEWIQQQGAKIVTARELKQTRLESLAELFAEGDYYISVDIDVFDPTAAPGTGTPEPGGLLFPEFSDLIYLIARRGNILGFDIMEVNPQVDGPGDITSHLASRCVIELLSCALD
ncbi:MAG: agmatinase [Deltaproteobacteria bacterium]|nr:agmatinase [Deltaproteobacteria bacterium]